MALNSLRKTKLQQGWQWEGKKTALPLHLSLVTCYFVVLHWYKGLEQGLCAALVKYLKSRRGAFIFEFLHLVFACIFVIPLREAAYWERKPHNHLLLKPLWQRLIVLLIHHVQLQLKSLSRQPQHALIQIDCVLFCFLNLYAIRFLFELLRPWRPCYLDEFSKTPRLTFLRAATVESYTYEKMMIDNLCNVWSITLLLALSGSDPPPNSFAYKIFKSSLKRKYERSWLPTAEATYPAPNASLYWLFGIVIILTQWLLHLLWKTAKASMTFLKGKKKKILHEFHLFIHFYPCCGLSPAGN